MSILSISSHFYDFKQRLNIYNSPSGNQSSPSPARLWCLHKPEAATGKGHDRQDTAVAAGMSPPLSRFSFFTRSF
jgi:hypothetical protein